MSEFVFGSSVAIGEGFYFGGLGAGGGFDPSDLAGLLAWYDTSDTDSVTDVGGFASGWADQTANSYNLSQGTAADRPAWSGSAPLDFDITDNLSNASRMGLSANPDLMVSVVVNPVTNNGLWGAFFSIGSDSNGCLICASGTDGWSWRHNNGANIYSPVTLGTTVVATWLRASGDTYGDERFFLNGVEQTSTSTTNPATTPTNIGELSTVGKLNRGADCDIYEVIIAENSSDVDAAALANWQKNKWGI